MHWLLVLALLSATTGLKDNSGASINRLAENALRERLGGAQMIRVDMARAASKSAGDFDYFNVTLNGFSADRLMDLAQRAENGEVRTGTGRDQDYPYGQLGAGARRNNFGLEDVLKGGVLGRGGDLGDIFGRVLGAKPNGRIGRIRLNASNFSFQGVRYDFLSADLGEIKFDWLKALRGDFSVQSVQPGALRLNLRADQAARLLAPQLPSIKDFRLRFANGRAFVGGKAAMYGVGLPFEIGGRLSVRSNQVFADDFQVSVARLRLPSFVVDEVTRGLNPLYDFDPKKQWPLAVNLNTAGTRDNTMSLGGGIRWVGFNRDRREPTRRGDDYRSPGDDYGSRGTYPDDRDSRGGLYLPRRDEAPRVPDLPQGNRSNQPYDIY